MLFIYRIIINLITLISPIIILLRLLKKKEDPKRFKEKFCSFSKKKIKGKLIWFHGASVGEILSVIPLIEKLEKKKEIKQILITSNTLSSSKILSNLKLKKVIHQFFPIDTNYHTQKFLKYWKPSTVIFIDSEVWPNMIYNIKKNNISLALINARITNKSFKRWKIFSKFAKNIFQQFDICLSSSLKSKKYLKLLGVKKIRYIGNLKFTQTEKDFGELNKNLKQFFSTKKIWCASSTHQNEEKICLEVHKKLKLKYKNLLTIIIPRHIHRTRRILDEIKELGLKAHLHESKNNINNKTDIYLVNSFGQTQSFFKICKTIFLGGSIIKHGGQNPLEPVRYGCKILHGPNVWNFDEIYNLLKKYKIACKINNSKQLFLKVNEMFNKKNKSKNLEDKFKNLGIKILNSTLKEMNLYIVK
ncbi:3-deoxy-D-manno-octulosonic acid transferase [Candidatus Pelagibacter sp.]|jgi:3-deoxy-D-manno-octulosonic-acid transferase|nr:3-deoxy-D-manno-octulosonic acid transferase [Candidatus Pelagibacter sp.]MDB4081968.1 3-deoxy-D-manno-octulosonic acid transferase [Candidatus Pelagibacter sp.]